MCVCLHDFTLADKRAERDRKCLQSVHTGEKGTTF